jgi:Zn-dependent protease with chaperone function
MKSIIELLIISIIFLLIGMKFNTITSFLAFLRFKKYKVLADEWVYTLAKNVMLKMNLNYKIHIAINKKSKKSNADIGVYKNDIFIVLHGKWNEEQLKFVISHELAHIKLKHNEQHNNLYFIICLVLLSTFSFNILEYVYSSIFNNKYKELLESVFYCVVVIIYGISYYINDIIYKKKCHQNEKDADLQAARIVGYRIAFDAINMLNDKSILKFKSTHPSNKERIKYLVTKLNC